MNYWECMVLTFCKNWPPFCLVMSVTAFIASVPCAIRLFFSWDVPDTPGDKEAKIVLIFCCIACTGFAILGTVVPEAKMLAQSWCDSKVHSGQMSQAHAQHFMKQFEKKDK